MVPPAATSNRPGLDRTAPVKAPRSCPNSSLSNRGAGMAPQLTDTKAPGRDDASWIARAMSSLPVPDSPRMVIGTSRSATRSITR